MSATLDALAWRPNLFVLFADAIASELTGEDRRCASCGAITFMRQRLVAEGVSERCCPLCASPINAKQNTPIWSKEVRDVA